MTTLETSHNFDAIPVGAGFAGLYRLYCMRKISLKATLLEAGDWYYSASWPEAGADFSGKCVGLSGTGSNGVQMAPVIAEQAAHLTVFQRTVNCSVPAQNNPLDEKTPREVKSHYAERRAKRREAITGQYLSDG